MAYVESHTVLLRHRKLRELSRSLRLKPVYVMGHLHALWHAALEQQEDGDLSSWSDDLIADSSEYGGDSAQYVSLLQHHRWLDGKLIHDWLDYAGAYLRGKYAKNNRDRLAQIWSVHGRAYGAAPAHQQPPDIQQSANGKTIAPDLTHPPIPPKAPPQAGGLPRGGGGRNGLRGMSKAERHADKRRKSAEGINLY